MNSQLIAIATRFQRISSITLWLLFPLLTMAHSAGCGRQSSQEPAPHGPALVDTAPLEQAAAPEGMRRSGWYQPTDETADHTLIARVTIPGVFKDRPFEVPIKKFTRINQDGELESPPPGAVVGGSTFADGQNAKRGFGWGGGLDIVDDEGDDSTLVISLHFYWTTPDRAEGKIDKKLSVKIGVPAEVELPSGCRLRVSWKQ